MELIKPNEIRINQNLMRLGLIKPNEIRITTKNLMRLGLRLKPNKIRISNKT